MHIVAFLEMANRVEASTDIWRRRAHSRHLISLYRSTGARPSWGDDSERDDESNGNTFDWSEKRSSLQLKRAQDRKIIIPKRAEHSTLLGRLGDMNQKYDAAAVDNRILRADIETREQKYILLRLIKETVKRVTGVNPLQWARPNMGMPVNNTPRIPSTTGTGLSPNRE
uniref:Uncharacterized protein n=2 Tax=Brassica TaxID=3705 RepID=A0A0D3DJZ1_BRAOL